MTVVFYDSSLANGYLKTGPFSAGGQAHREMMREGDCQMSWSGFGGYFNGLPEFGKKLQEADALIINYAVLPEDEPQGGEGLRSLENHIKEAQQKNRKLKVYVLSDSIIKIEGAKHDAYYTDIF